MLTVYALGRPIYVWLAAITLFPASGTAALAEIAVGIEVGKSHVLVLKAPDGWRLTFKGGLGLKSENDVHLRLSLNPFPDSAYSGFATPREAQDKYAQVTTRGAVKDPNCEAVELVDFLGGRAGLIRRDNCETSHTGRPPALAQFSLIYLESQPEEYQRFYLYAGLSDASRQKRRVPRSDFDAAKSILQSAAVLRNDEAGAGVTIFKTYKSPWVRVSQRKGGGSAYVLDAHFRFIHPADWDVRTLAERSASDETGRGFLASLSSIHNKDDRKLEALVRVMIDGLRPGPITAPEFLATTVPMIASIYKSKPVQTSVTSQKFRPFFCLERGTTRHTQSTGKTFIRDYEIVKDFQGVPWKIRAYSAGGMTAVGHVIISAHPDKFDTTLEQVSPVLESLKVHFKSPSLKPFGVCN